MADFYNELKSNFYDAVKFKMKFDTSKIANNQQIYIYY